MITGCVRSGKSGIRVICFLAETIFDEIIRNIIIFPSFGDGIICTPFFLSDRIYFYNSRFMKILCDLF